MPQLTFLQLAHKILEEEGVPLSPDEIWKVAQSKGYDKEVSSKGKTPWDTISSALYVDVRDNSQSNFSKTDTSPKRFVLRSWVASQDQDVLDKVPAVVAKLKRVEFLESDLHPFVVYYGFRYLRAFLRTIHHNKSKKKEFGEWVHPDIVGCYFPYADWKDEVVELGIVMGNPAVRFFSFELKRELNFTNLREAFFQAVSNSSWAHEGYLAAAEISKDDDFTSELERLSTSFGIGVIHIDVEDPDSTSIMFRAQSRDILDWEAINKLTVNSDFREFLRRVRIDINSREIRRELYDKVLDKEELVKLIVRRK